MEDYRNKFIKVAYKLYTVDNGNDNLVEEASADAPFQFLSGFGMALDKFEEYVITKQKGDDFDFTLTPDEAFGNYEQAHVIDLDREIFSINGHFDHDNIFERVVIPLQNEDGNRFMGKVTEVGNEKVTLDLNPPLAGKTLRFKGQIIEMRDASDEEIQSLINRMNGGCSCGCHCDDGCNHDGCHGHDGCNDGCGHCH